LTQSIGGAGDSKRPLADSTDLSPIIEPPKPPPKKTGPKKSKTKANCGITNPNILRMLNEDEIEDDYEIGRELGKGAFGSVKEVFRFKTGEKCAIKFISVSGADLKFTPEYIKETTEVEIDVLGSIQNENIVSMKDLFITDKEFAIVMELVTGGELFDKIVQLSCYSEAKACELITQVFEGVAALHEADIVHRDLKPENLLLSSGDEDAIIKIADFCLAKRTKGEKCYENCGTMMYLAPEMIKNARNITKNEYTEGYGHKVDVWATGIILYIMLCGFPPFYDEDNTTMFDDIVNLEVNFPSPEWDEISPQAKEFVALTLEKNPAKRHSAKEALQHPWIVAQAEKSQANLIKTVTQLKKFNARRKFKGAILATKALNKLKIGASSDKIVHNTNKDPKSS
jgi:serine/threonine protein kinase